MKDDLYLKGSNASKMIGCIHEHYINGIKKVGLKQSEQKKK